MASVEKYTYDAVLAMIRHNGREVDNPSNKDIDPERTKLNYSFPLNHGGLTDKEYYEELVGSKYLYGRGTQREKEAIMAFGWIVTLPEELKGYPEKEKTFFEGAFTFICDRYGKENVINNYVHYDEGGFPHLHVLVCPVTKLDHDQVQFKTVKTTKAVRLESGRYEYEYRFKLDENGNKIKVNNYSRMTDYYDQKIDCNTVLNRIEMKNFHYDLQNYLKKNGIEGKVINGKTDGMNMTVSQLKEFTEKTGLTLKDVREMQGEKTILESFVASQERIKELEQVIEQKDIYIESLERSHIEEKSYQEQADRSDTIEYKNEHQNLHETVTQQEKTIENLSSKNEELQRKLYEVEKQIEEKNKEVERVRLQAEEAKKEENKTRSWSREETQGWGTSSAHSWEAQSRSEWDQTKDRTEKDYEV